MLTIKSAVVKNMRIITLIMVIILLLFSAAVQMISIQQMERQNARQIFVQVEQILEENSRELERIQAEYAAMCLNDARTVAYILEYNPEARNDVEELRKIAANVEVDEIHIFDTSGVIVAGTHPEYFGLSFDSGEQIGFFKPLLADKSLEMVQDVMGNTAKGDLFQYSALWNEGGDFIVQVGMDPANVLRATEKNELSYIFSLLRTGIGYSLYAVDPDTETVVGSTVVSAVGKGIGEIGFQQSQMKPGCAFYAKVDQESSYCLVQEIGGNDIVWVSPVSSVYGSILGNEMLFLAGLVLISVILVHAVSGAMQRTVIDQIGRINEKLRSIQHGDLKTEVDVKDSKEFLELSTHINSMVESLLETSEKLEMSEKIKSQKEELEKQHEQLEVAVERAEAANKAKSEFLFNMSHDIRTPMNAILGFTNLALESGEAEAQREYLKNIDISAKQMLDLIDGILELSRIENHRITIEEELVNVEETYRKLCTIFDSELKRKELACHVELDVKHPYMYMDATHYAQIFLNVVSNAIKYTPNGGEITVSFRELPGDGQGACLMETAIEDNGIGMSAKFLSHAYETFSRERTSTVSGLPGTGLGLTIVKDLVELMHGTIGIQSQQGVGTRVTIRLPHRLGDAPAEHPAGAPEGADQALFQGRRVLLAEDIDINAMIAEKLLSDRGFTVERAKDGVECVDMLLKGEEDRYDLILMDIQMPNMDGYTAAQTIRGLGDTKKASIPILALTANAFKEDCDKAAEAGMNGHVAKPLDAVKMFQAIAEVLRKE